VEAGPRHEYATSSCEWFTLILLRAETRFVLDPSRGGTTASQGLFPTALLLTLQLCHSAAKDQLINMSSHVTSSYFRDSLAGN
jgi:hypothetical protein